MAAPAAVAGGLLCGSTPLSLLVRVVITGKVGASSMGNFTTGMPVKMSFLADQKAMYRFAEGNVVMDGIGPHQICPEEFKMTFGSKLQAHLGDAPPNGAIHACGSSSLSYPSASSACCPAGSPQSGRLRLALIHDRSLVSRAVWAADGTPGGFYFSLMQSRPVYDGAWVSQNPVDGSEGFPLVFHGVAKSAKFGGRFSLTYNRNTVSGTTFPKGYNTYSSKGIVDSIFEIYNGWLPNVVLTANMDKMVIEPAA